jgi:hypothetical protein
MIEWKYPLYPDSILNTVTYMFGMNGCVNDYYHCIIVNAVSCYI